MQDSLAPFDTLMRFGLPVAQGIAVNPADLIVQTGCGAILSNMFSLMCEEGDGILVPAPYYPGFDSDMKVGLLLHGSCQAIVHSTHGT